MNKKTILIAISGVVILIVAIVAFSVSRSSVPATSEQTAVETSAYGTADPLEGKPELNPVDKTNPFTNIKTNPFE